MSRSQATRDSMSRHRDLNLSNMSSTVGAPTTADFTRSAPAYTTPHRLDGSTLASSTRSIIRAQTERAPSTSRHPAYPRRRGTTRPVIITTQVNQHHVPYDLHGRTSAWVTCEYGPRWHRGTEDSEPSSASSESTVVSTSSEPNPATMCSYCANAFYCRALSKDMDRDMDRIPSLDEPWVDPSRPITLEHLA